MRAGDGREMIRHGGSVVTLVAFGLAATASGFLLWHGLGRHFGLGPSGMKPERRDAAGTSGSAQAALTGAAGVVIALLVLIVAQLVFFGRGG